MRVSSAASSEPSSDSVLVAACGCVSFSLRGAFYFSSKRRRWRASQSVTDVEETAGLPQLHEGATLQPGSAADREISFPFFQFSKTWNEEREHNEIQEMEGFFSFGQLKG